jgi:DNA-directed RNA polymerase
MERYKGYRVPISTIKTGSLLKKLAAREQTTSDNILHSVTKPDSNEPEAIGPLTSTEELLEALDLAIGSDGEGLEDHGIQEPESVCTKTEIEVNNQADVITPTRKRRRTKVEMEAGATCEEPKFVELTRLLPPVPKKGNFEVNTVKKSLYFFS